MRLIDADKLENTINHLDWFHTNNKGKLVHGAPNECEAYYKAYDIFDALYNAPTVEVRDNFDIGYVQGLEDGQKRPQGKWIRTSLYGLTCFECDNCHLHFDLPSNFCSNCGALMKKPIAQ